MESDQRNIIVAQSGNEALKIALEMEIALILLDVQMPDMDGFEVARLLKDNSRTKDVSILFDRDDHCPYNEAEINGQSINYEKFNSDSYASWKYENGKVSIQEVKYGN